MAARLLGPVIALSEAASCPATIVRSTGFALASNSLGARRGGGGIVRDCL